jgi:hypothetical protein
MSITDRVPKESSLRASRCWLLVTVLILAGQVYLLYTTTTVTKAAVEARIARDLPIGSGNQAVNTWIAKQNGRAYTTNSFTDEGTTVVITASVFLRYGWVARSNFIIDFYMDDEDKLRKIEVSENEYQLHKGMSRKVVFSLRIFGRRPPCSANNDGHTLRRGERHVPHR